MTKAQQEAMDIISHMSAKELQGLAHVIVKEIELKLKRDATQKALDKLRLERMGIGRLK